MLWTSISGSNRIKARFCYHRWAVGAYECHRWIIIECAATLGIDVAQYDPIKFNRMT